MKLFHPRNLVLLLALAFGLVAPLPAAAQFAAASTFEQRVTVEAVRNRVSRTQGGDFDDKLERISFTVKFKNSDLKQSFDGCKAELFVFAQSIVDRKAYQLLGVDRADFSLAARGNYDLVSNEVTTRYDTTGAIFGAKYEAWVLVVRDGTGKVLTKKSSSPQWVSIAEKMGTLTVGQFYTRELKERKGL